MGLIGYLCIRDSGIGAMENKGSRLPPFCNLEAILYSLRFKASQAIWRAFEDMCFYWNPCNLVCFGRNLRKQIHQLQMNTVFRVIVMSRSGLSFLNYGWFFYVPDGKYFSAPFVWRSDGGT